jgi:disulfide bond formation protein DsbB
MIPKKLHRWEIWDFMGLGSLGVLSIAYALWWGSALVTPCVLCFLQQTLHGVIVMAVVMRRRYGWMKLLVLIAAAANGLVAVYHVGVEHHAWGSAVCDGTIVSNPVMAQAAWQRSLADCSRVSLLWQGFSLAEWNLAYCVFWLGALLLWRRKIK